MSDAANRPSVTLNQVPIEWNLEKGDLSFFGLSSVLFWANPSLYRLLEPLVEEVGVDLFRLLVAHSSSFGTDEDYHAMVTTFGATFAEGFVAWGHAVSVAGWGAFSLPAFDPQAGTALVRVTNPWELRMQKAGGREWGCPFLLGKVIGLFTHALGRSCWADEHIDNSDSSLSVELRIYPSTRTIDEELARLRRERLRKQEDLARRADEAVLALKQKDEEVQAKDRMLQALSAPIIQVWDGVLAVPFVGELSREIAEWTNAALLERVSLSAARYVVLDLTGLSSVDRSVAAHIVSTAGALRLIGASCAIVGLSPELARTMVALDVSLGEVQVLRTLQDALRDVVGLTERSERGASTVRAKAPNRSRGANR